MCIRAMLTMENRHVRTYRHMSKWHIAVTATHHLDTICTCLFLHYASTLRSILDEKFKYQETKCMKICPLCPTRQIRRVYFLIPPSIDPLSDSCIQIIPYHRKQLSCLKKSETSPFHQDSAHCSWMLSNLGMSHSSIKFIYVK